MFINIMFINIISLNLIFINLISINLILLPQIGRQRELPRTSEVCPYIAKNLILRISEVLFLGVRATFGVVNNKNDNINNHNYHYYYYYYYYYHYYYPADRLACYQYVHHYP